jgi:hypothetical protein
MRQRLLADTCSALKLAAFGKLLFETNALPKGDLIPHPSLFRETSKWPESRKNKHKEQFSVLNEVRSTPGLANDGRKIQAQIGIIEMTQEELGLSIGRVDKEILAAVLSNENVSLVTNDRALSEIAETGFTLEVANAEEIIIEALDAGAITTEQARTAVAKWFHSGDTIANSAVHVFRERGIL